MSPCTEADLIGRYHDDELSGAERRAVERHLTTCPACADELRRLRTLSRRLRTAPRPHLSAADKGELRTMMAAAADERGDRLAARPGRVARWLTAAAAVVFLVSGSQVLLNRQSTRHPPGGVGTPPWQQPAIDSSSDGDTTSPLPLSRHTTPGTRSVGPAHDSR